MGLDGVLSTMEKMRRFEQLAAKNKSDAPAPLVWSGTQREFGDHILKQYAAGRIKGDSNTAVLDDACLHYVVQDRKTGKLKRMTAKSILNSLYARDQVEKKK